MAKKTLFILCYLSFTILGWQLRELADPVLTAHRQVTNVRDRLTFWD